MPHDLQFDNNHILLQAQKDIAEICMPLFNYLDIGYFHFRRTFQDGSYFILTNNSDWPLYFIKNKVAVKTPIAHQFFDAKSYFCMWQGNIPDETMFAARNMYGIKSAIAIVEKHETYFDSYSFGSNQIHEYMQNVYINNIDALLKFIPYFFEKSSLLLKKANKQLIIPSVSLIDANLQKIMSLNGYDEKSRFIKSITMNKGLISKNLNLIILTDREMECLHYLAHGKNRKEIGLAMGLSPRTIDTHLEKAKNKLGCLSSAELIDLWWKNQGSVFR